MASVSSLRRQHVASLLVGLFLVVACLVSTPVRGVDRNKFRTCAQTDFCRRTRSDQGHTNMNYHTDASSVQFDRNSATITFALKSALYPGQPALGGKVQLLNDGLVRLTVDEISGLHRRHPVQNVLQPEAMRNLQAEVAFQAQADRAEATWAHEGSGDSYHAPGSDASPAGLTKSIQNKLTLGYNPFRMEFTVDGTSVLVVNGENLLHFEQFRERNPKPTAPVEPPAPVGMEAFTPEQQKEAHDMHALQMEEYVKAKAEYERGQSVPMWPHDTAGAWEESHGGHTDHKAKGPAAIGLDMTFINVQHVYGIPEHASTFSLKNTVQMSGGAAADYREPYRLFNLDVFEFELDEPMALYGTVPYIAAHTVDGQFATGVLWLNTAETFVDISSSGGSSMLGLTSSTPKKTIHWMSETGVLDAFFVLGPKPSDLFRQYTRLTGAPFMPPQFAIGYHQCRWNYKSQEDVAAVDAGFDEHDIPVDVLWLDIEHTDAKKYFTWDKNSFSRPADMQKALAAKGRRMVTIVDPHIKRTAGYKVHDEATALGHYIKKKDGSDYDGWCWPGSSSYLDFFQQKVRDFWSHHFSYAEYEGSTPSLFVWNDMNEPSVFNGPEVTMQKENLHTLDGVAEKVEHRDVHNQYGQMVHQATFQGLLQRDQGNQRPFVLTRAFFAGSQRSAAVWTGDNTARWDHLKSTQPMLLSLAVGQIPFSGADVGGFFGDPDAQLLTRWYQAGAYQPFFRGHAHIDTKRREPWLFGEPYTTIIRAAIRQRYALLPYLYTLFYLNTITGMPILRPLWVEFPTDPKAAGVEDQFLLGNALLIRPVVDPDVTTQLVYLPSGPSGTRPEVWYNLQNDAQYQSGQTVNVATPLQHIPVWQRGGTIVVKRERARRCSTLMAHDPYTLVIALSSSGRAEGQLFVDDSNSYRYQTEGAYLLQQFTLADGVLTGSSLNPGASAFADQNTIERIVILGAPAGEFSQATLVSGTAANGATITNHPLTVQSGGKRMIVRKPDIRIGSAFTIRFQ